MAWWITRRAVKGWRGFCRRAGASRNLAYSAAGFSTTCGWLRRGCRAEVSGEVFGNGFGRKCLFVAAGLLRSCGLGV